MAELFLGTAALQIFGAEKLAEPCRASGYSLGELRTIFFDEVGPAFAFNLLDVAGEWAAWHPEFIRERMLELRKSSAKRLLAHTQFAVVRSSVMADWKQIEAVL